MTKAKRNEAGEQLIAVLIGVVIIVAAFAVFATANALIGPSLASDGHVGKGQFTEYDLQLAKKLMDKDGDGRCDTCGMDVNMCIQNGQVQCDMGDDGQPFKIGPLDVTKQKHHYHVDFKVFISGEPIDFNQQKYFVKSRFAHVEADPLGDSGEVLHLHASGVPLWLFFESVGMELSRQCFALDDGTRYCEDGENTLKFHVNGRAHTDYQDYVPQDLDRILISYGPADEDVHSQLAAVTDFSKNH